MTAKLRRGVVSAADASPFEFRQSFPAAGARQTPGPGLSEDVSQQHEQQREAEAWNRGLAEGEGRARAEAQQAIGRERAAIQDALTEFAGKRKQFFQQAEADTVQLGLAIARKILQREADADPLALREAVRSALGAIEGASQVALRVHPDRAALWRSYFDSTPELKWKAGVVPDSDLAVADVVLESSLGAAALGAEARLAEFEDELGGLLAVPVKSAAANGMTRRATRRAAGQTKPRKKISKRSKS